MIMLLHIVNLYFLQLSYNQNVIHHRNNLTYNFTKQLLHIKIVVPFLHQTIDFLLVDHCFLLE